MPENKFSWYRFVELERARHMGSSVTRRSKHIDMFLVRDACGRDKSDYMCFIKNMKSHSPITAEVRKIL